MQCINFKLEKGLTNSLQGKSMLKTSGFQSSMWKLRSHPSALTSKKLNKLKNQQLF